MSMSSTIFTITSSVATSFGNCTSLPVDSVATMPCTRSTSVTRCGNTPCLSTTGIAATVLASHRGIRLVEVTIGPVMVIGSSPDLGSTGLPRGLLSSTLHTTPKVRIMNFAATTLTTSAASVVARHTAEKKAGTKKAEEHVVVRDDTPEQSELSVLERPSYGVEYERREHSHY